MAWHPMKPETRERRARERALAAAERRETHMRELERLAERDGPDSIWPGLLAEARGRQGQ